MRTFNLEKVLYSLVLLLSIGSAAHAGDSLFAKQIQLDYSEISIDSGYTLVAAFIPTGSDSEVCFVNLGDSGFYLGYFAPTTCIRRTYMGQKGLVVIVSTAGWVLPTDFVMRVSVYQNGAKFYGAPVFYLGP